MRSISRRSLPLKSNPHLTLPSQNDFPLCLCEEHWPSLQWHLACFSTLFQKDLCSRQVIVWWCPQRPIKHETFVFRHLYDHFLPRKPVRDFRWMYNDCEQKLIDCHWWRKDVLKDGALFLTNPYSTTRAVISLILKKKSHAKNIAFNDLNPVFFFCTWYSQRRCFSIQKHLRIGAECRALKMLFSKWNYFEE